MASFKQNLFIPNLTNRKFEIDFRERNLNISLSGDGLKPRIQTIRIRGTLFARNDKPLTLIKLCKIRSLN